MTAQYKTLLAAAIFISAANVNVSAQLSEMNVVGVEESGKDPDGPVNEFNKDPYALFKFDVENGSANNINGYPITAILENDIELPFAGDDTYDAYGIASRGYEARSITLHHPDFNNCRVVFADYLGSKAIEGGSVYKIKLKVPSAKYITAASLYNNMDFEAALEAYTDMLNDTEVSHEEKILAENHIEGIDSLISYRSKADEYLTTATSKSGKDRDRDLYRARILYNRIYKESGLVSAGLKVEDIKNMLGVRRSDNHITPLNRISKISAKMDGSDLRAFGNDAVTYTYQKDGKEYSGKSALLIIRLPLKDAKICSEIATAPVRHTDGEIWLYVRSAEENGKSKKGAAVDSGQPIFTIEHPDYQPFTFSIKDLDEAEWLSPEKVYVIELDTPSLVMATANSQLARLDLEGARGLFRHNFEDAEEQSFAEKCQRFLDSPSIVPLISDIDKYKSNCDKAEIEWMKIITGKTKFDNLEERNGALATINNELTTYATRSAQSYKTIYSEAKKHGITLDYAQYLQNEYENVKEGVRRLPIILKFDELIKENKSTYKPGSSITTTPTVKIEFLDGNENVADVVYAKVKKGAVSIRPNNQASRLFAAGVGKIRISTPKEMNYNQKGKEHKPYNDTEFNIRDFKIKDYTIVQINVTLVQS